MTEKKLTTVYPDNADPVDIMVHENGVFTATIKLETGESVERSSDSLEKLKDAIDRATKLERPKIELRGTLIDRRRGHSATAILRGIHGGTGEPRVEIAGSMVRWDKKHLGKYWSRADCSFIPQHVELDLSTEAIARTEAVRRAEEAVAKARDHRDKLLDRFSVNLTRFRTYGRPDIAQVVKTEAAMAAKCAAVPASTEKDGLGAVAAE